MKAARQVGSALRRSASFYLLGQVVGVYGDVEKRRARLRVGRDRGIVRRTRRCHAVAGRQFAV